MPILTTQYYVDEATKPLHAEIEALRKQVKEWQDIANRYAKYEEQADEQIALRDLEISKLREVLEKVTRSCYGMYPPKYIDPHHSHQSI
jgi:hypothetical protein